MALDSSTQVTVKVGDRDLLASGVVHLEGESPVVINVANLRFVLTFKTDDGQPRYMGTVKEDGLYLDLYNHKNSLGEGMLAPLEIAKIGDRILSMTYYANTINLETNARRLEYALYLGGAK